MTSSRLHDDDLTVQTDHAASAKSDAVVLATILAICLNEEQSNMALALVAHAGYDGESRPIDPDIN